jgi:hypothetical protein
MSSIAWFNLIEHINMDVKLKKISLKAEKQIVKFGQVKMLLHSHFLI